MSDVLALIPYQPNLKTLPDAKNRCFTALVESGMPKLLVCQSTREDIKAIAVVSGISMSTTFKKFVMKIRVFALAKLIPIYNKQL